MAVQRRLVILRFSDSYLYIFKSLIHIFVEDVIPDYAGGSSVTGPRVIGANPWFVDMVVSGAPGRISASSTDDVSSDIIVSLRRLIKFGSVCIPFIPTSILIGFGADIAVRAAIATILISVLDNVANCPDALVRLISGLAVHRHRHFANVVFRHD